MGTNDEIIITYGVGYVFNENKYVGILKTKSMIKSFGEFDIYNEIEKLNLNKETDYKGDFIEKIEEALGEKVSNTIHIIVEIKNKEDLTLNNELIRDYQEKDFLIRRYKKDKYNIKYINHVQAYLNKCLDSSQVNSSIKFDKVTLKIILTTSFGEKLSNFIGMVGQASNISDGDSIRKKALEEAFDKNTVMKINYSKFDFISLLNDLVIQERSITNEEVDYKKLLKLVNKDGSLEEHDKYIFEKKVIRFLKGQNYLYFSYAKVCNKNIITTLDSKRFLYKDCNIYRVLSKNGTCIYDPVPVDSGDVILDENVEFGVILAYEDEKILVCSAVLDKRIGRVSILDKFKESGEKIVARIEKYIEA